MKKQKIIAVISAMIMTFGLTACGDNGTEGEAQETLPAVTTSTEELATLPPETSPAENIESEITDWNMEDLAKEIVINGKTVSLPFKLDELGAGYTMMGTDKETDGYPGMVMELYYDGNYFADIWADKYDDGLKIIGIQASAVNLTDLKIGDISFESTKEQVEEKLGKSNFNPGFETDTTAMYAFKSENGETANHLLLMYDSANNYKVSAMQIYFFDGGRE